MPITESAKKAIRQSLKRRKRNLIYKNKTKSLIKEVKKLVSQNKIKEAKNLLPQVYKTLDKAAKVGVIKKNTAARKKSRLTKLINRGSKT
ncbi:MAG: 30S ribosomal protein S20 [Candidatus Nealsonbacteria bacterium CG_4_9_14_0_2_um_filter_37_38]|uniref:Small ribosomal subunit protein bS20 n=1 Tax=Candidatus Nealsonbacteria bacterium CG_4_10_14_0_8_um_filter_37_14 TaxID=1974684 RepID=A0A2M7R713_9BACT|nr:MAG: 30S ribosomal protein S20 [Candidatus Nealsonbacteria bacterium CG11_big_fil_rev_8_21_14_0_20_37_68]PIW91899.1 MAG: 30S ribosomal protein S20 [Candidatus Nealsonbacteria bacterium CG_4_8_14_3_um_filter_37_23]PIY89570.1 MAG: 30S ribosomal protein S20 [Candidatus Nealsonbacteria bacterium CG_4_10_14_0_8_um_filter_37_14]PJC51490.1 MAG: 30S ribosomal protein S20 [Candidatus Nealsonbacteria bacterium CG_4_9_14_0_2_um_filter_37_38]